MNNSPISKEFKTRAIAHLEENAPRIEKCFAQLNEEDIWKKPNGSSNSIGNLVLHLCGNITQYILSSLGDQPDRRERDLEFSSSGGYSKNQLLEKLKDTVKSAIEVMDGISDEQLLQVRSVQGFRYSGIGNIIHVVEHYSYHTGQIAFWTKLLQDRDLGFYEDIDLNQKNL